MKASFFVYCFDYKRKQMKSTISTFRIVSTLEAVSYLLLLGIAMPLKYIWDSPQWVKILGNAHGFLFIAYVIMAYILYKKLNWSKKTFLIVFICSLLPFGPFYAERKYLPSKK